MRYLILFFFICGTLLGQSNLTLYQLPTKTDIGSDDYLMMYDNGLSTTNKITLGNFSTSLSALLSWGLGDNYTWTGTHNFTSELQVPSTLSSSLSNGIGYEGGFFSWTVNDSIKVAADRAWTLSQIGANSLDTTIIIDGGDTTIYVGIGDTTQYARLSADQTFTGNNTFVGGSYMTSLYTGDGANTGVLRIPWYTSTNTPSSTATGNIFYNATSNKLRVYDSGWTTFLDSAGVASLVQTGSYLQTSGTQTGLSSTLTWSSGTITPYYMAFGSAGSINSLKIPMDDRSPAKLAQDGSFYADLTNDNLHVMDDAVWLTFLDSVGTKEAVLNDIAPTNSTNQDSVTLSWGNKNYSQAIVGKTSATTYVKFEDYTSGWATFFIAEKLNSSTNIKVYNSSDELITIKWIGGTTPLFDEARYYEVTLKYYNTTTCLGSYTWYD